jgi:hypothetical protein
MGLVFSQAEVFLEGLVRYLDELDILPNLGLVREREEKLDRILTLEFLAPREELDALAREGIEGFHPSAGLHGEQARALFPGFILPRTIERAGERAGREKQT